MKSGCCSTICGEINSPMFDIAEQTNANIDDKSPLANDDDDDKSNASRLDVVAMLSPTPRLPILSAKVFMLAWIVSTMALSIKNSTHHSFWLAYLTHWGITFTAAYMLMSVISFVYLAKRPPENQGGVGLLVKITWALCATAIPMELMITILFWILEFDGTVRYVSVMVHGGAAILIMIDAFILSRIPLRMKQFILSELFAILYILWTVVHAYSGLGNPYVDTDEDKTDDAIYSTLAWKNNTTTAAIVSLGVVFIANPVIFLFCRALSRILPRRLCEVSDEQGSAKLHDDEEAVVVY